MKKTIMNISQMEALSGSSKRTSKILSLSSPVSWVEIRTAICQNNAALWLLYDVWG